MGNAKIFVVEDDPLYAKMLNHKLSMDPEFEVSVFNDGASFLKNLKENPSVVTLDHSLPDISGLDLLKRLKKEYPNINVVVLSAQEDVSTAVEMLREGAYDYIIKDSGAMDKVWHVVHQANEKRNLQAEVEYLTSEITAKYNFQQYLKGSSAPMQRVFSLLEKSAKANITVSITGDTGTGKELAAKSIHFNSERMKKPFIAINVAAIPKELIESELFGYEKGAFTGADQTKMGKFEEANKGTIFLDEIGEMDLNMQAKLLRVLQEREVCRLGSNKMIPLDVRVIVATHRDLLKEVKEGRFREDLYYRLLGISVEMPPLNERGSDIIVLAKAFIADFCKENGMPKKDLSQEAIDKLMKYKFPGNVRELKAIAEIAAVMSEGNTIEENDVQFNRKNEVDDFIQEELTLEEYNSRIIKWYLNKYNNNVLHVADKLDVGKSTIYRMLKEGKI
ncbi:MAG: sigma-54-dependent transcriptional regulator [Flavobacteriia bacterium]|jgi:two-component system response regulator AtoC